MIYRKPAWFIENPHDKGSHMLLNITFVRVCIVAYITLTPYWKKYKYAPVVFWFAVRLEINIRKNRLLFPLWQKTIYTHHYALKSLYFGMGGGLRVFTFLFHLLYIYARSLRIKIRSVHQDLGLNNQSEIGVFSRVNVYISYAH